MRRLMIAGLALLVAGTAQAQGRQRFRPVPDSAAAPAEQDPRAMQLRQQIQGRFERMVQADLELTDDQMQHVRQAVRANQDRRIGLARREQDLRREIMRQMERGGSADNDSVARMTEQLSRMRVERAQSDDQLVRDLGFLPPVKRARLLNMMQRFEQRVQDIRRQRMGGRPQL